MKKQLWTKKRFPTGAQMQLDGAPSLALREGLGAAHASTVARDDPVGRHVREGHHRASHMSL